MRSQRSRVAPPLPAIAYTETISSLHLLLNNIKCIANLKCNLFCYPLFGRLSTVTALMSNLLSTLNEHHFFNKVDSHSKKMTFNDKFRAHLYPITMNAALFTQIIDLIIVTAICDRHYCQYPHR